MKITIEKPATPTDLQSIKPMTVFRTAVYGNDRLYLRTDDGVVSLFSRMGSPAGTHYDEAYFTADKIEVIGTLSVKP